MSRMVASDMRVYADRLEEDGRDARTVRRWRGAARLIESGELDPEVLVWLGARMRRFLGPPSQRSVPQGDPWRAKYERMTEGLR
jgi:hypothetical protein